MWKRIVLALLIVAGLCLQMNGFAFGENEQASTRAPANLKINGITLDGENVDGKYVKEAHQITVWLNNTGSVPLVNETMNCTVYNTTGVEKAFTNVSITTIANNTIDDQIVGSWTPLAEITYWINVTIDRNGTLVCMNKSFVMKNVTDMYPKILSPLQNISVVAKSPEDKVLGCKIKMFNNGNKPILTAFSVDLEIFDVTNSSNVTRVFNNTKFYTAATFNIGTNFTYEFPAWSNHTYGLFKFVVKTNLSTDNVPANNEANVTINVSYTYWDEVRRGNLIGYVLDGANAPIAGVDVTIANGAYDNATAITNATGGFRLEGLPVSLSPYTLNFTKPWYEPIQRFGVYVNENLTKNIVPNITMLAIPPCTVSGYVMDPADTPLPGVYITVSGVDTNFTNETGYYTITGIPVGTYTLSAVLDEYNDYTKEINFSLAGESLEVNISLVKSVLLNVSFTPANGSENVNNDEPIIITFNIPFDYTTVNKTTVLLTSINEDNLSYEVSTNLDDTIITLTPGQLMKCGYTYTVTITAGILNTYGKQMFTENMSTTFTITMPRVISAKPIDQAANVSISTTEIYVKFNVLLQEPLGTNVFSLMAKPVGELAKDIPGTVQYDPLNKTLKFALGESLEQETKYTASVANLISIDGIDIDTYSWEFSTEKIITTGSIHGYINGTDGPISNAKITIKDVNGTWYTSTNGYFNILDIPAGNYVMVVELEGYDTKEIPITVTANQAADLKQFNSGNDFILQKESGDNDKTFLEEYGLWILIIVIILVVLIIVIVVIILMMRGKGEEEEEEGRPATRRAWSAPASGGGEEGGEFDGEGAFECPECHEIVSDQEEACPNCGAEFEQDLFQCPECNTNVDPEATTCPNCGTTFQEEEKEEEEEEEPTDDEAEEEDENYEVEVEDEEGVTRYKPSEDKEEEAED